MHATEARTPEGAIKCFIVACVEHGKYNNPEAKKMMGMCLHKDDLDGEGAPKHSMYMWQQMFK